MNYGEMKKVDIANGVGVRVSLFVSGCTNHCPGCFQPETWDFDYGKPYTKETEEELLEALRPSFIRGFTLLGGEPFEPKNQEVLVKLLRRIKATYPEKDIWCYTGFVLEDLLRGGTYCHTEVTEEMVGYLDVLVDGRFEEHLKNISLQFRGSENQRVIDLVKTREQGKIILWNGEEDAD